MNHIRAKILLKRVNSLLFWFDICYNFNMNNRDNKILFVSIIIVLFLLLGVVATFIIINKDNKKKEIEKENIMIKLNTLDEVNNFAKEKNINVKVGNILSSDLFYDNTGDSVELWADYGCLAVEMETAELYTLAAKYNVEALSILTISDHIFKGEETSPEERQNTFTDMMEVALQLIK